jgi:P27 family predicted phage terminase small subunit
MPEPDPAGDDAAIVPVEARGRSVPEPISDLDRDERGVWDRLAPDLHRRGLLEPSDCMMLGLLCEAVIHARRAKALLSGDKYLLHRDGRLVTNPAWRIYRDATDRIRMLAHEFGLSPASRVWLARLGTRPLPPADP